MTRRTGSGSSLTSVGAATTWYCSRQFRLLIDVDDLEVDPARRCVVADVPQGLDRAARSLRAASDDRAAAGTRAPRACRPRPGRRPLRPDVEPDEHLLGIRQVADDPLQRRRQLAHKRRDRQDLIARRRACGFSTKIDHLDFVAAREMGLAHALEIVDREHGLRRLARDVEPQMVVPGSAFRVHPAPPRSAPSFCITRRPPRGDGHVLPFQRHLARLGLPRAACLPRRPRTRSPPATPRSAARSPSGAARARAVAVRSPAPAARPPRVRGLLRRRARSRSARPRGRYTGRSTRCPFLVISYSRTWFEWLVPRDLITYSVRLRSPFSSTSEA